MSLEPTQRPADDIRADRERRDKRDAEVQARQESTYDYPADSMMGSAGD